MIYKTETAVCYWVAQKLTNLGYTPVIEELFCPVHTAQKAVLRWLDNCEVHIEPTQHSPVG